MSMLHSFYLFLHKTSYLSLSRFDLLALYIRTAMA